LNVEVKVLGKPNASLKTIPDDAQVSGTLESLGLFRLLPPLHVDQMPAASWAELKTACKSEYSAHIPWVERIERDMLNAANGISLGDSEASFISKSKTYRAILTQRVLHWDGTSKFTIVFVETLPRKFVGDQNTSLILAGMIMASRFRFQYFEEPKRVEAKFDDKLPAPEFEGNYRQFLHDLERMREESMELGLLDPVAFIKSFGEGRQGIAESFLTNWKEARDELDRALPSITSGIGEPERKKIRPAILEFLRKVEPENVRFLQTALEAYREELAIQLRKSA